MSARLPAWRNWQERFDTIPQQLWKQRGNHTRSRDLAADDQVSEVLLHPLRLYQERCRNLFPLGLETLTALQLARAAIPVAGVGKVALLAV